MQVDAALSNGESRSVAIEMTPEWLVKAHVGERVVVLALQAVLPSVSTGLVYLFAASAPGDDIVSWVEPLPPAASELLLYAPLVPLVKCQAGFQALSWAAWKELATSSCLQDFGMPPSLATSLNAGLDDELDLESLVSHQSGLAEASEEGPETDEDETAPTDVETDGGDSVVSA